MAFTPANRMSAPDPAARGVVGHKTSSIVLADEAEYDLGAAPLAGVVGRYEVSYANDERPLRAQFNVASKAAVAFTGSAISSNVLTLTVASGAGEAIQTGQWIQVQLTDPTLDANGSLDGSWVLVTDQTATTIVCAFTATNEAAMGAGTAEAKVLVFPEASQAIVLHDSIVIADNQDTNLGKLERGIYTVEFLSTTSRLGIVTSDGTVMDEYMEINSTDEENVSVTPATSDTVTALFVSNGDVIFRNGADIPVKVRVTFTPHMHSGLDQDGALCFYTKADARNGVASLRVKNRLGASKTLAVQRVA